MATATKTAATEEGVPVWDEPFEAVSGEDLSEIMDENTGGDGMRMTDLTRVTFPRESAVWSIEDPLTPDSVRSVSELAGVVVQQRTYRQFYRGDYDGGNDAPDCMSTEGEFGAPSSAEPLVFLPDGREVQYGGDCSMCPLNEWGSDLKGGNGKACREYRMLALLEPSSPFPIIVRIPPTQLGLWHRFGVDMAKMRLRLSRTVIGLGLKMGRDKKPALSPYVKGVLPDETAALIAGVRDSMKMLAERAPDPAALAGPTYDGVPLDDDEGPF